MTPWEGTPIQSSSMPGCWLYFVPSFQGKLWCSSHGQVFQLSFVSRMHFRGSQKAKASLSDTIWSSEPPPNHGEREASVMKQHSVPTLATHPTAEQVCPVFSGASLTSLKLYSPCCVPVNPCIYPFVQSHVVNVQE